MFLAARTRPTAEHVLNGRTAYTESFRQILELPVVLAAVATDDIGASDHRYIGVGQDGPGMTFPTRGTQATLPDAITDIFTLRADEQVRWLHTGWIVAAMEYADIIRNDDSMVELIGDSVRLPHSTAKPEGSIASIWSRSRPNPTVSTSPNFRPEPIHGFGPYHNKLLDAIEADEGEPAVVWKMNVPR